MSYLAIVTPSQHILALFDAIMMIMIIMMMMMIIMMIIMIMMIMMIMVIMIMMIMINALYMYVYDIILYMHM
eukprot:COSAG06_NODE_1772_length_8428_cov_8.827710_1_plen_72_part_00